MGNQCSGINEEKKGEFDTTNTELKKRQNKSVAIMTNKKSLKVKLNSGNQKSNQSENLGALDDSASIPKNVITTSIFSKLYLEYEHEFIQTPVEFF